MNHLYNYCKKKEKTFFHESLCRQLTKLVFYLTNSSYFSVNESSTTYPQTSLSTIKPAVYITEYFDFSPSSGSNDDSVVDMQSSLIFDSCDQMDDDL